jgi:hypothetical protein
MSIFGAIAAGIATTASKVAFVVSPYAPLICLGGGLVLGAGSIISACKDTITCDEIMDADKERMNKIKACWEQSQAEVEAARVEGRAVNPKIYYSKRTMNIEIYECERTLAFRLGCHYKRTIILALAAGALLIGGHYLLSKEIARLAAINAGLLGTIATLKQNMGEEAYNQALHGIRPMTTTTTTIDENGQEQTVESTTYVGPNPADFNCTEYAQPFYDINPNFDPRDPEGQMTFIKNMEAFFDKQLHTVGHLYLNDVYKKFAFEQTELGHDHGWTWKKGENKHVEITAVAFQFLVDGEVHNAWMVDFNCDGDIKHKLCTSKRIGDGVGKSLRFGNQPTVAVA